MTNQITQITQKYAKTYTCDLCDFTCYKNSDYIRHKLTLKHNRQIAPNMKLLT